MTEAYSFEDTDALLASLSSSSVPTLSPSDLGNGSSSGKSSSYGLSPQQKNASFPPTVWDTPLNEDLKQAETFLTFEDAENPLQQQQSNAIFQSDEMGLYQESDESPLNYASNPIDTNFSYKSDDFSPQSVSGGHAMPTVKSEEESSPDYQRTSPSGTGISMSKITKPKKDRSSHNIIEKKYRTNINDKIVTLRDAVPALRMAAGDIETTIHDLDGLPPASKLNKGVILTKATEYIKHLERKNHALLMEAQQLRQLIQTGQPASQQQIYPQQFTQAQQQMYQTQPQAVNQFQPAQDYNGQAVNMVSAQTPQQQYQMGMSGKVIMGGLATMVGQQLFTGTDNFDYRGLNAFPILGLPQFQVFLSITKFVLIAVSVIYIFNPTVFSKAEQQDSKKAKRITLAMWYDLIKELVFVKVDEKKKLDIADIEISSALNNELLFNSEHKTTFFSMLFQLLRLHTYTPSFEVSFGKLVLSKLLITYSDLSTFLNLNTVFQNAVEEISNQKVSETNLRYFFKELQTPNGKNSEAFRRFVNIGSGLPLSHGCLRGHNDKGYSLIMNDDRVIYDYKALLVSLRANELFREVLFKYINLTFNKDVISGLEADELKEIKKEIWDLLYLAEHLSPDRSIVQIRVKLFKSVLNEKYVDSVLQLIGEESSSSSTTTLVPDSSSIKPAESEYEDEEIYDSDIVPTETTQEAALPETPAAEEEHDDDSDSSTQAPLSRRPSGLVDLKFQKILSRDLANALTSASILKYIRLNKREEAKKLLKYILTNKDEITLLSFISMFKLSQKYPKDWLSGYEAQMIEPMIAQLRLWVGDSNNISFNDLPDQGMQLKREISDDLVEAGRFFSEVE